MKNYYNCIYMYINKINGKRYVGQAVDFNRRHRTHNLKSTDKFLIDRAFNKYGEENFEIVILKKDLQTQCLLNFWECYYIEKYNTLASNNKGYNISNGGHNGNAFAGKTDEEMLNFKQKLSNAMKGKYHTEETKRKMSKLKIGENHPMYGKHRTEETKIKQRNSMKGKYSGDKHPRARKIVQYDLDGNLIRIWEYIKQASDELGIARQSINRCCKFWEMNCNKKEWFENYKDKPCKSAGGFIWKYYDEKNG